MNTLFSMGEELLALARVLDECEGGEVPPEVDARLTELLSAELPVKLDRCVAFSAEKRMRAAAARAEAEQWVMKARREERQADWMDGRVQAVLEVTGQDRVETAAGRVVSLQANGGPVPLEIETDVNLDMVAPSLLKTTVCLDKDAVRAALVRGDRVAFARLGTRQRHLRVRT